MGRYALALLLAAPAAIACSSSDGEPSEPSSALTSGAGSGGAVSAGATSAGATSDDTVAAGTSGAANAAGSTSDGGAAPLGGAAGAQASAGLAGEGGSGGEPSPAGGAATAGQGAGGAAAGGGSGGAMTGGAMGVGGSAGDASAGAGGSAAMAGASGEDGDPAAPRPLNVTASAARHEHNFRASAADPAVSFNDNDQVALFDNRAATLMGKLVLTFGGAGETKGNLTGGGEFCAARGFHVIAIAAFQAYNIVIHGPDFYGDARRTVFEGVVHTREDAFADIEMTPADGVAQRTQKALQYLHAMNPEEDWGYYLQEDGSVRWSDVIFTGVSHGASNSARFASLVRASRVVSIAGPRDNLCEQANLDNCGGEVATWLNEVPKTPLDRFYAITGVQDDQHTQHLFAMAKLGYVGEPTRLDGASPPYGESHQLVSSAGHDDFCAQGAYRDACNYAFGVPPENQAGIGQ